MFALGPRFASLPGRVLAGVWWLSICALGAQGLRAVIPTHEPLWITAPMCIVGSVVGFTTGVVPWCRPMSFGLWRRLGRSSTGNVAVIVAVVLPIIAVVAAGATELAFVWSDKSRLQDTADSAALAGASQLGFGSEGAVQARARQQVEAMTSDIGEPVTLTTEVAIVRQDDQPAGVRVDIRSVRPSFFGDLLPPGGFKTNVSATAMSMSSAPLCVFATSPTVPKGVHVAKGKLRASGCVVHSNHGVDVGASSQVQAALTQAVGLVTGSAPNIRNGAELINDPFAALATAPANWNACLRGNVYVSRNERKTLAPGVQCGKLEIEDGAIVTLAPGIHYFRDRLQVKKTSRLVGANAVMVIGPDFELKLDENNDEPEKVNLSKLNAKWDLQGAKSGSLAGFVLVVDRARTKPLKLPAKMVDRLEGVAYFPTVQLEVYGLPSDGGADDSNWTVLVGKELKLTLDASIMLHTDYAASAVPVPAGVGNRSGGKGQRLSD